MTKINCFSQDCPVPYIYQEELCQEIKKSRPLIIDCRDDDVIGGNIKGSINISERYFRYNLHNIYDYVEKNEPSILVLHCMESIKRGPRCAFLLNQFFNILNLNNPPKIYILFGGAYQWIKKYYKDPELVENFDDEYWFFETC